MARERSPYTAEDRLPEHRVRILIVEDEVKVVNAVRKGLEAAEYEVAIASTGEEGVFLAQQEAFDLVLLDLIRKAVKRQSKSTIRGPALRPSTASRVPNASIASTKAARAARAASA